MMKHDRSLDVEVLVKRDAGMPPVQQFLERSLAILDRSPAQVFPVDLDQVERAERRARPVTIAADQTENGQTSGVADDGFAVDETRMTGNAASACATRGKRWVRSLPFRLIRRTFLPSRRAKTRKPSCLIS